MVVAVAVAVEGERGRGATAIDVATGTTVKENQTAHPGGGPVLFATRVRQLSVHGCCVGGLFFTMLGCCRKAEQPIMWSPD